LVLGVAMLLAGPALGQQEKGKGRGRGGFGGGGIDGLVRMPEVQKELKLDKEEVDKATEALKKVNDAHQEDRAKLRDLDQEERMVKMRELGQVVYTESMTALNDVFKPDQIKRLKQLYLQRLGAGAFTNAEVVKELKLTSEQQDKIKTINEDSRAAMRELFQSGQGGAGAGAMQKMEGLNKETMSKVVGVLTDDQKKSWKEMTGDEFKFPPPQFGGRGRRGGGGGV
jgi:hypothetical protein